MALARRDWFGRDRFGFDWPERWRRMFDFDFDSGGFLRVEEFQDKDTLVIRAELPDIDPEKDVEVAVSDGTLHIRAHREEKTEHKEKELYRSEFRYGSFERDLLLPSGVDSDDVKASYKDGILEIRVPSPQFEKPATTRIEVGRG